MRAPKTVRLSDLPDAVIAHILSFCSGRTLARAVLAGHSVLVLLDQAVHVAARRDGRALPPPWHAGESLTRRLQFVQRVAARDHCTLAAGSSHSMCITASGNVLSWGGSEVSGHNPETEHLVFIGHLGHGAFYGDSVLQPSPVSALATPVREVATGKHHCLLLAADGVYSFGAGEHGQLGHGGTEAEAQPRRIEGLSGSAEQVACGRDHSLVLTHAGSLLSFGRGSLGQLGTGAMQDEPRPVHVPLPARAVQLSGGQFHSLAVTEEGELYSWGSGTNGRLGHGDTVMQLTPRRVCALPRRVKTASAGSGHSLAVLESGELYSWGQGYAGRLGHGFGAGAAGRLGHGNHETKLEPALVEAIQAHPIVHAVAGWEFSVAVSARGAVFTFGAGDCAQLGLGDTKHETLPVLVTALHQSVVKEVAPGNRHCLARTATGELYTFGTGAHGELGHPTHAELWLPKQLRPSPLLWNAEAAPAS